MRGLPPFETAYMSLSAASCDNSEDMAAPEVSSRGMDTFLILEASQGCQGHLTFGRVLDFFKHTF